MIVNNNQQLKFCNFDSGDFKYKFIVSLSHPFAYLSSFQT